MVGLSGGAPARTDSCAAAVSNMMRCAGPAERSPRAQLCPLWDRAVMLAGRPCGRRKRAVRAFKGRQACSAARLPQSERASGEAEPGAGLEGASLQAGAEAACWLVSARLRRPSACSTAQMQRVCSAARARGARRCARMDLTLADAAACRGARPRSLPPCAPRHLPLRLSCANSHCRRAGQERLLRPSRARAQSQRRWRHTAARQSARRYAPVPRHPAQTLHSASVSCEQ